MGDISLRLMAMIAIARVASVVEAEPTYNWTRTFGGSEPEICEAVAVSLQGDVYVVGGFQVTADMDPTAAIDNRNANGYDIFITKLNSDGSYGWSKTYWSSSGQYATCVAVDNFGDVVVAGLFTNTVDFDPTENVDVQGQPGDHAPWMFVTKLHTDGTYAWTRSIGFGVIPTAVAVGPDNGIAVTGAFGESGPVDFDPSQGVDTRNVLGVKDAFVTTLRANGDYGWTRTFGSTSPFPNEDGLGIAITKNNEVVVTGRFRDTVDFDPGGGVEMHMAAGAEDGFVTKFDAHGGHSWTSTFGSSGYDAGNGIAVDSVGNVYVTGEVNGVLGLHVRKLDSSGNEEWVSPNVGGTKIALDRSEFPIALGGWNGDIATTKLDRLGQVVWSTVVDTDIPASATAYAIGADGRNNVILAGSYYTTVDFDTSGGVDPHTSNGSRDVFVSSYRTLSAIPTMSHWGVVLISLLLLAAGTICIGRRAFDDSGTLCPSRHR